MTSTICTVCVHIHIHVHVLYILLYIYMYMYQVGEDLIGTCSCMCSVDLVCAICLPGGSTRCVVRIHVLGEASKFVVLMWWEAS